VKKNNKRAGKKNFDRIRVATPIFKPGTYSRRFPTRVRVPEAPKEKITNAISKVTVRRASNTEKISDLFILTLKIWWTAVSRET
jgi:hypothetical protein